MRTKLELAQQREILLLNALSQIAWMGELNAREMMNIARRALEYNAAARKVQKP